MSPKEIAEDLAVRGLLGQGRSDQRAQVEAAIDAATKPLRDDKEALTLLLTDAQERLALHERHDEDCPCSVDSVLLHAYSCLDCTCEIGQDFREMRHQFLQANSDAADAEARNKALVEALRAFEAFYPRCAQLLDGWHADGTAWTEWDESVRKELTALGSQAHAALAAHEEPKQSLPKASERA